MTLQITDDRAVCFVELNRISAKTEHAAAACFMLHRV
jgi:hypothetical protein